ncbi:MAG: hypothetical protein ACREQ2_12225 [Candidatus Binatia bacterium]
MASEIITSPSIELRQVSLRRHTLVGSWSIGWMLKNTGAQSFKITSVRLPHGQFKSTQQQFKPSVELPPGGVAEFQTRVHCDEPPGLVTENAFLILNVNRLDEEWRIFARVRVVVNPQGEPESATELVTTQKVGFSGVQN